mmetsp:Transcript_14413/g.22662  ORF Transcript_14413/g.22662 Transcript_14413/m.22662 type:complete len:429 (+) Transcript_14413:3-1289(+)
MEHQAVLLAGGTATRMYPLTNGNVSKHFLPIANRPMISYQIEMLEKASFRSVIILITSQSAELMKNFILHYKGPLKITVHEVPEKLGTAEAVVHAKQYLTGDFVVVAGDLILDPINIRNMIDVHRIKDASCVMLAKKKPDLNEYLDYIGLEDVVDEENLKKLIVYLPSSNTSSTVQIQRSALVGHPNITIHNKLLDAHFYVFSHWVLEVMEKLPYPKSIKSSLLPKLIELQNGVMDQDLLGHDTPEEALCDPLADKSHSLLSKKTSDRFSCFVYLAGSSVYCGRAHTSKSFMDINRDVAKGITPFAPTETKNERGAFVAGNAKIDPKSTVGALSIVGAKTTMGAKGSVKHSVIGKNCTFGNGVKVINSIVLDGVTTEDGVTINNSIVCSGAILKQGSNITASTVDYNTIALENSVVSKQILRQDHISE